MDAAWRTGRLEVDHPKTLLDGSLALLEGLQTDPTPSLRWYRSTETAIVLGRGQRPNTAQSTAAVEVISRSSGGGAVLLDPTMLSLDVAIPTGHPLLDGDLSDVFLHVGEAWATALSTLGVPSPQVHRGPALASRQGDERQQLLAAVCYATMGRGEISVHGRKLVGLSQRRRRPGALVQCGLLRQWQPGPLLEALGAQPDDQEIHAAAVGLDELGLTPSDTDVMRAVNHAFAASTG